MFWKLKLGFWSLQLIEQEIRDDGGRIDVAGDVGQDQTFISLPTLAVGINGGFGSMNRGVNPNLMMGNNNNQFRGSGGSGGMPAMQMAPHQQQSISSGVDRSVENSMYLDLAMAAMEELVRMETRET